ncbi:MAG: hypothetical protein Q9160_005914 [Pyrenula sp. 1 TL-2023]
MDVLCKQCGCIFDRARSILSGNETANKSETFFWSIKEWENLALTSSCHLCTILYHAVRDDKDAKAILGDSCANTTLRWKFDQVGTILSLSKRLQRKAVGAHQDVDPLALEAVNDLGIRLTESLPQDAQYLTLSHRWSSQLLEQLNHHRTTDQAPSTVPTNLMNSPVARTFRDAVQITRILGYRYLWIDALCINQKDESEKAKEIGSMAQIYARAVANISATGAIQAEDGLFFERDLTPFTPCPRVIEQTSGSGKGTLTIVAYRSDWHEQVENGLLNQRAWVFQERMLAPRVLHFARRQVFWECFGERASEAFPNGYPDKMWQQLTKSTILYIKRDMSRPELRQVAEADIWSEMVRAYLSQSLTFSKDRLPAISALAKKICRIRNLTPLNYVVGHWDFDLPLSLLWDSSSLKRQPDKQNYIAPSWSWASINLGAYPWGISARSIADLINVTTCPKHDDRFGEISSGYLTLCCSLSQILWHPISESIDINLKTRKVWRQPVSLGSGVIMSWDTSRLKVDQLENEFCIPQPKTLIRVQDDIYHLAPICDMPSSRDGIYGLILHRTDRPGQFVRVGTFSVSGKHLDTETPSPCDRTGDKTVPRGVDSRSLPRLDLDNPCTTLKRVLLSDERALDDDDDYLEVREHGRYVIKLV